LQRRRKKSRSNITAITCARILAMNFCCARHFQNQISVVGETIWQIHKWHHPCSYCLTFCRTRPTAVK
jgi:hypothetical protein